MCAAEGLKIGTLQAALQSKLLAFRAASHRKQSGVLDVKWGLVRQKASFENIGTF